MTVGWSTTTSAFRSHDFNFNLKDLSSNFSSIICRFQDMPDSNMNQQSQPQMQQGQQQQPTQSNQQQNQDLVNCDLTNLQSLNCNDSESDELLRQLTEDTFELETFFSEFSAADIKVSVCQLTSGRVF